MSQGLFTRQIVVVIPTYNEAGNIEKVLNGVRAALPQARLLVVDDDSPDGTGDIVERYQHSH